MLTWLDQRTGAVTAAKDFLTEDVPGGASYWYAFGSATVFAMILQIATGIFLCFYYAPSTATAWESTKFIIEKVPAGPSRPLAALLGRVGDDRVHGDAPAASAAVGRVQEAARAAVDRRRDPVRVTLVLGLTGYLLPWDLNALLASRVAINISGNAPILGPAVLAVSRRTATASAR